MDSIDHSRPLRTLLKKLFPGIHQWLRARFSQTGRIERRLLLGGDRVVRSGPFEGMKLTAESFGSRHLPKLTGTYEQQLHRWIFQQKSRRPRIVVDVGCAEGYYAIGFARMLPDVHVFAFDASEHARELCARNCEINDVRDRVTIGGNCTSATLAAMDLTDALIICDCEGFESELFDQALVDRLGSCSVIVECHEPGGVNTADYLLPMFWNTHRASVVSQVVRDIHSVSRAYDLGVRDALAATDEGRFYQGSPIGQIWCLFSPKMRTG